MSTGREGRAPTPIEAVVTLASVLGVIVVGIRLQSGLRATFLPLALAIGIAATVGLYLRRPWQQLQDGIIEGTRRVGIAIVILLLVGALVGLWVSAGIIPALLYYGLQVVSPRFFLPTAFLVCVIMSVGTGTSYGTISTAGVALMGMGAGLGQSAPLTAGAVISGAYFGDKMSPLSDSTNIAAAMGQADLFRHIRSMMYTTAPAAAITLVLYAIAGQGAGAGEVPEIDSMLAALGRGWNVGVVHFVPIVLIVIMALARVPALALLFVNVVLGAVWGIVFQSASATTIFVSATSGYASRTGLASIDQIMSRGGMASMEPVIVLILLGGALGGVLHSIGVLDVLLASLVGRVKTAGGLIVSVLLSAYAVIAFTGNQALALILPGQVFRRIFRDRGIDRTVMTRTLEDAGTIAAPVIPWSAAGGLSTQMLGVPTLEYAPYVWFVFLVPIFSIVLGYTGVAVWPEDGRSEDAAVDP